MDTKVDVHNHSNNVALVEGPLSMSYRDLTNCSKAFSNHLVSMGVTKGSVVALIGTRSINYVVSMLAALKCGVMVVHLDLQDNVQANWMILCLSASLRLPRRTHPLRMKVSLSLLRLPR